MDVSMYVNLVSLSWGGIVLILLITTCIGNKHKTIVLCFEVINCHFATLLIYVHVNRATPIKK